MDMERLIAAGISSLVLAGCAAGPWFEDYAGEDAACIDVVERERFNRDNPVMRLERIDGVQTPGPRLKTPEKYCIAPGEHRLALWGWRNGNNFGNRLLNGHAYLDWSFEPGRRYELRVSLIRRNTIHFALSDITGGRKTPLLEFDGDDWPEPLYAEPVYTLLLAKGPVAPAVWDRTQTLAGDFASDFGLPRDDGVCPYGFYGIARGDPCITYRYNPSSSEGTSLVISYSAKLHRSILIFTRSVPLLRARSLMKEVKEQFDQTVTVPLQDEFAQEIRCEIGCF
jgi:hypothetical protein